MIQLYPKGQTDFSLAGIELHAESADVNYLDNGRFDLDIEMPIPDGISFDYGMILRCSVPEQRIGAITLGMVSYWEIAAGQTRVPLYSKVPTWVRNSYNPWVYGQEYSVGAKVSYDGKNYQAITDIVEILTTGSPDVLPNNWSPISGGYTDSGKTLAELNAGDIIIRTDGFNNTYMQAADMAGHAGFIEIAKCVDRSQTEPRVLPAQTITEQSFTITEIEKSTDGKRISIHAEHVSYGLGRCILEECNLTRVNPATAIMMIRGAMMDNYAGEIYTNLTETITADWSFKNAQNALLDPKAGLLQFTTGHMIRNDLDVYLLQKGEPAPRYAVTYGINMEAVKWNGSVSSLVTRIYPIAQKEDGSTLMLPEKYIDTVRAIPFIRPEVLNTGLKVGTEEEQTDGTKIKLTEEIVLERMREAANNRFNVDECDRADVTLELDWVHLPDTEEYAQYRALINAAPEEWITVNNSPLGIAETIQLTGYTFDPIALRYKKSKFGPNKVQSTVAGYDLKSGSVTGRVIGQGAVSGQNIQANTITAREVAANSITAEKIASKQITTELLAAGSVTADEILAGSITAEKIASSAITAAKIAADAITSEKISAGAITTRTIEAGAVTADKIGANAVTAEKISATDLEAIQAKLEIADISRAEIGTADIGWAQIKELNAESAYFGQTVFQEAIGGKLYVPRLSVGYAQMLSATIGDLVIQASNGDFYRLDVNTSGTVSGTRITPTQQEIEDGHTSDGRTIYMGTDILAEDLSTENVYASHALMDEITANIINVDKLLAREAVINWLNVQDISSNTYIRSTIGNWESGSTITQTINGLSSRITSLGYGTVYMQPLEPDHSDLSAGDIWIQTVMDSSWQDVLDTYSSWQNVLDSVGAWQALGAYPVMYVWDGIKWQEMYDSYIPVEMETRVNQLSSQIELMATKTEVDRLSGEITEYAAQIRIMADQIEQAVSTVNAKAASFYTLYDPTMTYDVTVGDIWVKGSPDTKTWQDILDNWDTWTAVKDTFDAWQDLIGTTSYLWNGFEWVETSSRAQQIVQETRITESAKQIEILAYTQATIEGELYSTSARLNVTNDKIEQEVQRATTAEGGKLDKTAQYQTADAIVTEAVSQAGTAASGAYIHRTATLQTAEQIVSTAEEYTDGLLTSYSTREQTNEYIRDYVRDNAYGIQSGIDIAAAGVLISGSKYIRIESGSQFRVKSNGFGVDSTASDYVLWAGAASAASSKFRVTPGGRVTLTELAVLNADGTNETTINLRSIGLWWGSTIRSYSTDSGGYVSSMTLSNGASVNFKSAASVLLSAAWTSSGATRTYKVTATNEKTISETLSAATGKGTNYYASIAINEFDNAHKAYGIITASPQGGGNVLFGFQVDASSEYSAGVTSGANGVTLSAAGWVGGANVVSASNGRSVRVNLPQITLSGGTVFSSHKTTVNASGGGASGPVASLEVDATSEYNAGDSAGYSRGYSAGVTDGEAKFAVHSSPTLYIVDSHGVPTRYTGTVYDKIS